VTGLYKKYNLLVAMLGQRTYLVVEGVSKQCKVTISTHPD